MAELQEKHLLPAGSLSKWPPAAHVARLRAGVRGFIWVFHIPAEASLSPHYFPTCGRRELDLKRGSRDSDPRMDAGCVGET